MYVGGCSGAGGGAGGELGEDATCECNAKEGGCATGTIAVATVAIVAAASRATNGCATITGAAGVDVTVATTAMGELATGTATAWATGGGGCTAAA